MSTKNDKTLQQLQIISQHMIDDFDGKSSLLEFYLSRSTRELDVFCKEHYDISYYYAKKVFTEILDFPPKTHASCQAYWKEHMKQTHDDRYGGVGYASPILAERSYNTSEKLYGNRHYSNNSKALETKLEKYGTLYVNAEQIKKTSDERYGGIGFASPILLAKSQATRLELYGDPNYSNPKLTVKTCFERWGKDNYNNREQMHRTCEERFGVPSYSQTVEFHKKCAAKYHYNDLTFDSSWELAVWIYCKDHDIIIERLPIRLSYVFEDKQHYYFPDFKIEEKLVEIKGDHMLDKDNNLINAWDTHFSDLELAKQRCMEQHNVLLITGKDLQPVFDYIELSYGKNYLKQFKREELEDEFISS